MVPGRLRSYLLREEGGTGTLSVTAFAAGVVGAAVGTLIHSPQIALATRASGDMTPDLAGMVSDLGFVLSMIALLPQAVMLAAVAAVVLRTGVFPMWLGWLSAVGAVVHVIGWFGVGAGDGPLAPGGWFTYVPYTLLLVWLTSVTTVMVVRLGRSTRSRDVARVGAHRVAERRR